jgi:hypothetical protein
MKIQELRDSYYEASANVSDRVRQLALAGIAVIWLLKTGDHTGGIKYGAQLLIPLSYFAASLTTDFCQYVCKTLIWGSLNTYYWKRYRDSEKEVRISGKWNWVVILLFWLKTVLLLCAYVHLLWFMYAQLSVLNQQ